MTRLALLVPLLVACGRPPAAGPPAKTAAAPVTAAPVPVASPTVTTIGLPNGTWHVTSMPDGTVRVIADVQEVDVYVDGVLWGKAPLEIRPSGAPVRIELRKDGY